MFFGSFLLRVLISTAVLKSPWEELKNLFFHEINLILYAFFMHLAENAALNSVTIAWKPILTFEKRIIGNFECILTISLF